MGETVGPQAAPTTVRCMNFEELGFGSETLKSVAGPPYLEPTPIQARAVPVVLRRRDVMGYAHRPAPK